MPPSTRLQRFEAVYRQHYGFVVASASRFGVERAHLDDAAQEVFLVAYSRWSDVSTHLRPWLYAITRRVASNHRRGALRAARKHDAAGQTARDERPAPRYEAVVAIDEFLRTLPERDRELFVLAEIEGLTGLEIADALHLKPSTAYARLKGLQTKLHRQLDPGLTSTSLARCKAHRRPATVQGWAALMPLLGAPTKVTVWAGLGLCAAIGLGGVTLGAAPLMQPDVPTARSSAALPDPSPASSSEDARLLAPDAALPVDRSRDVDLKAGFTLEEPTSAAFDSGGSASHAHGPESVSHSGRTGRASAPGPSASGNILAWQTTQLRRARQALDQQRPRRALGLLAGASEAWGQSPLSDARTALRIEALCGVGDDAQARREASAWVRTSQAAAMKARIQGTCVGSMIGDLAASVE